MPDPLTALLGVLAVAWGLPACVLLTIYLFNTILNGAK